MREEDPVVEKRAAEVVRHEEDEHRAAPDDEQRPPVLQPALREHLALLAEVRGEEDDQRDLPELARLELEPADVHPETRAVDRLPEVAARAAGRGARSRRRRRCTCSARARGSRVAARRASRRRRRRRSRPRFPAGAPRVVRAEPVDLRQPDGGEQRCHRQEVRIGERHRAPRDDVRDEVEGEEERGVAERAGRDLRLERDVDAREADRRENSDGEEGDELAVPEAQRQSPQRRRRGGASPSLGD